MMNKPPTADQCDAMALLAEGVDSPRRNRYAMWHPQWGGYAGLCCVEIDDDPCFDVAVWHDGDFPYQSGPPNEYHYCEPMQLVEFAVQVMELQQKAGRRNFDNKVDRDLLNRLRALMDSSPEGDDE